MVAACEGEDGRPTYPEYPETVLDLAKKEADLSTFVELAEIAGLNGLIGSTQASVSVFAPNNAAFNELGGELTRLRMAQTSTVIREELNQLLRFHMTGGTALTGVLALGGEIRTITATVIHVEGTAESIRLIDSFGDEASVVKPNIHGGNGILHVIDAVLTPPSGSEPPPPPPGTLAAELTEAGFSSLVAAAARVGLDVTLGEAAALTVFAPNNAAFTALGDISGVDNAVLENVLLHHVVSGTHDAAELATNPTLTSLAGLPLAVTGDGSTVGGQTVGAATDIEASNGVAHEMNQVIVPPTIVEYLPEAMGLTMTNTAVMRAAIDLGDDLTPDVLMGDMPITFFAPTGMAWTMAGINTMTATTATLAAVLRSHTVVGQVLAADLTDGSMLTTLNGNLTVDVTGTMIELVDDAGNRATVTTSDIRTLTGAVHVVDGILGQ
jgi:transforming growth factor-beta-induced protein